ncbi:hypothetical protein CgunFtcFv8_001235 [Champsocephalus gunnari]|uniref:DEUBAD domain-containing protein n=1 Tax=Champsocephalus gunnari TaxID=52237 RepID=A0AAN8DLB7_CHAGU|nr:hypothetical protein CgunFtcFv8_001235 [Champsocephalus gunnari]
MFLFSRAGEGGLQSLLGNMSHNQLMQLIGPTGLGGIGGLGALAGPGLANLLGSSSSSSVPAASNSSTSPSTAVTPTSSSASSRLGSAQVPTTPITPVTPTNTSVTSPTASSPPASSPATAAGTPNASQPIQLRDLQSILATMNVPIGGAGSTDVVSAVDLSSVLTPEVMAPILSHPEVQQRLSPFLPSGESLPQSSEELNNTLSSPQFQQAMSMFSSALASGQLGPLMNQFGLPAEAVDAANKGDVEAFAKAMETETKSDQDGDSKDKKDDDEDMSLD